MLRSSGPIWDKIKVSESAGVTYLSVLEDSREHAPGHPRWPYLFVEPRAIQIQAFLILLHFADTVFCFFLHMENLWPPFVKQVWGVIFPMTFAYSGSP